MGDSIRQGETPYPQQDVPGGAAPAGCKTYDGLIVGGGPAGLSAAIYLARFNRSVLVVDAGEGRSTSHEVNENYLGFPDGIAARDLRRLGQQQAVRFGVQFAESRVDAVTRDGVDFRVDCGGEDVMGRTLILATGVVDQFPEFEGVEEYVGRSLFWCITCDGWTTRGKRVIVVGRSDEAAMTCLQFQNFTDRITFLTNCEPAELELSERSRRNLDNAGVPVTEGCIARVHGESGMMRSVELRDGRRIELDMMVSQQGSRPNSELAKALGAKLSEDGYVEVDEEQRTGLAKLYAAGDLTRMFSHQVVTAAHEGATAGQSANYDLYRTEQREE
ncbi:MAG: NAD(P)/FAD-dependent oxidoreductase [Chloroflexota bacterium]|nr:NAD(P)/FAD-dependent oxidoreductase [Chloroflexota bacterium]